MGRITTLPEERQRSRPVGAPEFRLDTRGAAGEAVGAALTDLGQTAARIGAEMKQRADVAAVAEAEAALGDVINRELYDAENGFLAQKGKNALDRSTKTAEALQKERDRIAREVLKNDDQRRVFGLRSAGTLQQSARQIEGHTRQQIDVVEGEAYTARKKTALDTIANDPTAMDRERANFQGYALAEAKRLGLDAAGTARLLDEWQADATEAALNARVARRDGAGAKAFLDEDAGDGRTRRQALGIRAQKYEATVAELSSAEEAEGRAASILDARRDKVSGWLDSAGALADAEALPNDDPALKSKVRALVGHQAQVADALKQKAGAEKFNEALSLYEQGVSLSSKQIAPFKAWMLDPKNGAADRWKALKNIAEADARSARADAAGLPDPEAEEAYGRLMVDMADNRSKYALMSADEFLASEFVQKIPKKHRPKLIADLARFHAEVQKDPVALPSDANAILLQRGRDAKVFPMKGEKPDAWSPKNARRYFLMKQDLEEKAAAFRRTNGTAVISDKQWNEWIDPWLIKGKVEGSGWIWDDEVRKVEAVTSDKYAEKPFTPNDDAATTVPDEEAAKIREALQKEGLPQDDEAVRWMYDASRGINRPRPPHMKPTTQPPVVNWRAAPTSSDSPWARANAK